MDSNRLSRMIPRCRRLPCLLLSVLLSATCAHAAPGEIDPSFNSGSGFDGSTNLIIPRPDGKILVAGTFGMVKGLRRPGLARLNADGSGDASFDAGDHGAATSMALQPDGKLLLVTGEGLKRLHADGQLDAPLERSVTPQCAPDWCSYGINTLLVQPDGRILVGGFFETIGTTPVRYGIARLHPDGRLDTSFRATLAPPDPQTGIGGGIIALALRADGKIWVGGTFSTINGEPRQNVARLNTDGSLDASFHPAGAIDGLVYSMISQPDGKLLVAGDFTTANRANRSLARLNANGSLDPTFVAGTDLYEHVNGIALQPDGRILVAGSIQNFGWTGDRLTRLEADGRRDPSFQPNVAALGALALQKDGKVLIGGILFRGEVRAWGLVRLEINGSPDPGFVSDDGLHGVSYPALEHLAVQGDGNILIAGTGVHMSRLQRHGVARVHADGRLDPSFTAEAGMNGHVAALALEADGNLLIGGDFTNARADERLPLARLFSDGALDPGFRPEWRSVMRVDDCPPDAEWLGYGCYLSFATTALAVQPDGKILIGGSRVTTLCFETEEGISCRDVYRHFVARFHPDGALDSGFAPSEIGSSTLRQAIKVLTVQPNGSVLVAGDFSSINGQFRAGIARLRADGSVDPDFNAASAGTDAPVEAMVLQPDGRILIAGGFSSVHDSRRRGVARLLADGALDPSFDPGAIVQGTVTSLALQPDGRVLVAGDFTVVKPTGAANLHVARLYPNGLHDPSFDLERGPSGPVWVLALQSDGNVLIGGDFITVDGLLRPRLARLMGGSPPPALTIGRADDQIAVSWLETGSAFVLQQTSDLTRPADWSTVASPPVPSAGQLTVRLPLTGGSQFFRLAPPIAGL